MVAVNSTMVELGTPAPDFRLPDTEGRIVSRDDFKTAPGLLVMFICNHCPFVKHIRTELAQFARETKSIAIVGINSNDAAKYPDDSPAKMRDEVKSAGYVFSYLVDEAQSVAKAYRAACTPDFFLYDKNRRLVYRGQFDDGRPNNGIAVTGNDLRAAVSALLQGKPIPSPQKPSIGCNIKWKPGQEPDYFPR
jgi:peroxiredoxin